MSLRYGHHIDEIQSILDNMTAPDQVRRDRHSDVDSDHLCKAVKHLRKAKRQIRKANE